MDTKTITWEPYLKAGTGSRTLTGRFVTLTPAGSMSVSQELTAAVSPSHKWMRVEYAAAAKKMRLTPIETGMPGSLRMQKPGERRSKGAQVRLGCTAGLRVWGLIPKASARYCADWQGDSIVVDLAKPFDGSVCQPEVSPIAGEEPPSADASEELIDDEKSGEENSDGDVATVSPCCLTCAHGTEIKGRPQRICDCMTGPNRRKLMPGTGLCKEYRLRKPIPPDRSIHAGVMKPERRHGSNPRGRCPICGTEHAVSMSGLFPHDVHGVDYRGGRGDKANQCPGRQPKGAS